MAKKNISNRNNSVKKVKKIKKKIVTKRGNSKILRKTIRPVSIKKKDITNLRYAMIHSRVGDRDGVSIVMKQIEDVMHDELNIPRSNILYLVGKSKLNSNRVFKHRILYDSTKLRKLTEKKFKVGFGGTISEDVEKAIQKAQQVITKFFKTKKIDVLIAHNTCHPVNFILSVALSRYYRDSIKKRERTPKYLLWWHDSHLERKVFSNPAKDVERYLLQGVPGDNVEYIFFINSTQYGVSQKYFEKLDGRFPGYSKIIYKNHDVIYNTTDTYIDSYDDLETDKFSYRVEKFISDYNIYSFLKKKNKSLKDVIFCLQHTRMVDRKRIDFALEYVFKLLDVVNKRRVNKKLLYFLISGHDNGSTRKKIVKKYRSLCKVYGCDLVHLEFAEDHDGKTDICFEEYPRLIAKLRGFSTYFSEIEGFGNNLLEVLASGLIPVVYEYPVFKTDISKYKFKLISLDKYEVNMESITKLIKLLNNDRQRKIWANRNLEILRKRLPHRIIAKKLVRGIIRKRVHI